jgi:hypothetical protein
MSASLTRPIEDALRHLAKNEAAKVSTLPAKFRIPGLAPKETESAIWAWLKAHNGGRRTFSSQLVDRVLAAEAAPKSLAANKPAPIGERINRALRRPVVKLTTPPPEPVAVARPPGLTSNVSGWLTAQGLAPASTAQTFLVSVSPAVASSWLLLNQGNRNPSKAKIRRFAAAIKAGRWVQNGETVKFSITGRLLDGQSRLRAIVLAGVPAVLELRAGLPDDVQQSMDIGEVRKGTHTLEMLGEKYPNILSPALRYVYRWQEGTLSGNKFGTSSVLENMEIAPLLKKHAGLGASVGWCVSAGHKVASLMPASEAAFFHYVFGCASKAKRDSFFEAVATGLGLTATHPAYHLRERLQADRAASARMDKRERFALVIKAWNAHLGGQKVGQLRFTSTGNTREAFPEIGGLKGGK